MSDVIKVYCDGACRGNGKENNIGAYGAVMLYKEHTREISKAFKNTTNNKMELMGAIESLLTLKKHNIPVEVYCDSAYVINGINEWIYGWIKKGWETSTKKPVENKELWQELYDLKSKFSDIKFIKVKGHSDNEFNNRADELCNLAMDELEGEGD